MTEDFSVRVDGAQAVICFTRPDAANMLSLVSIRSITKTVDELARSPELRVLLLRAEGSIFCMGRSSAPGVPTPTTAQETREQIVDPILDLYRALRAINVPVVAQVQGPAAGLGCAIVAACDMAIASEAAVFSLPEMEKDLPPTLALSAFSRRVAAKVAGSMVWGLAHIDARTALAAGLVGEVHAHDRLQARVNTVVEQLCTRNRLAVAAVKNYLRALYTPDFESSSELAGTLLAGAMSSIRAGNGKGLT